MINDPVVAIESVLEQFGVSASVTGRTVGPSVTRFELTLGGGVRVEKIAGLEKNLAYETAAESVRLVCPIPGKSAVGIELPNTDREMVSLNELLTAADDHPLTVPIGKDIDGAVIHANLGEMPHLLVAGTTGSGKSCFINAMLVSLLRRTEPENVRLVLIDPKAVELTPYNGADHLLRPVITEVDGAIAELEWLVREMEDRYEAMQGARVRHISALGTSSYPYIVVVIDELADLMMGSKDIEALIVRLAQKSRAAGIHLVLATQRPSVDVVTGLLKANVPSRLAFATATAVDSRVILDEAGAEQLLGKGDGLFLPVGARHAIRVQSAFVSDSEIDVEVQAATGVIRGQVREDRGIDVDVDALDGLIKYGQDAVNRVDDFLDRLTDATEDRMPLFFQSPSELGDAGIALVQLTSWLREIRKEIG